jgi:RIO kinase 1
LARDVPGWVIDDDFVDVDLGLLKTGKEAEISVVERTTLDGSRTCLLARKRYRPRTITAKGELQALGFERAPTFRHDLEYRDGRNYGRRSRDRRAVEQMTAYGRELVKQKWHGHEHDMLTRAWGAGVDVPYPVSYQEEGGLLLELVGRIDGAAPRLAQARLDRSEAQAAWHQLIANLRRLTEIGIVHSDLSAYNVLWWDDRVWIIDFPQAVDLYHNPHGFDFLHRDVTNVGRWARRRGLDVDVEAVYAEMLGAAFP